MLRRPSMSYSIWHSWNKVETNWTCSVCFDFVETTKFRSTLLPKTATMSKQRSTLSKGRNLTINSFDIVAVCGNKVACCFDNVACCFDIVAGVAVATVWEAASTPATMSKQRSTLSKQRSTLTKQRSTLLPHTATMTNDSIVKFRPFDKVECCFDIVAGVDGALQLVAVKSGTINRTVTNVAVGCWW